MVNITDKNIFMTKGDTIKLTLDIKDKLGKTYYMAEGDSIKLAVRKPHATVDTFVVTSNTVDLYISSGITANVKEGEYQYDVQITFANGEINTIVPLHKFVIQKEVS